MAVKRRAESSPQLPCIPGLPSSAGPVCSLDRTALAARLCDRGKYSESIAHGLRFLGENVAGGLQLGRIFKTMALCFRKSGNAEARRACEQELRRLMPVLDRRLQHKLDKTRGHGRAQGPLVSVIIPTFNRRQKLARCLDSFAAQTIDPDRFEVVVVDDGSTDDTAEYLADLKTPFRLRHFRQNNAGAGAARALAVVQARGTYLFLTNDDALVAPDVLELHLRSHAEFPKHRFSVMGRFDYDPDIAAKRALLYFVANSGALFPQPELRPGQWYGGDVFVCCHLSIRRDVVLACGNFDPRFRVGEDTDLGLRLARAGCPVVYDPQARAWHDHTDITLRGMMQRIRDYAPIWASLAARQFTFGKDPFPSLHDIRGLVTPPDSARMRAFVEAKRPHIEAVLRELERYDQQDFARLLAEPGQAVATDVLRQFGMSFPSLFDFHRQEGLCAVAYPRRSGKKKGGDLVVGHRGAGRAQRSRAVVAQD